MLRKALTSRPKTLDEIKELSRDNVEYCVIPVTVDPVGGGTYA